MAETEPINKRFDIRDRGICKVCGTEIAKTRFYCDDHRPEKRTPAPRNSVKQRKIAKATPIKVVTDVGAAAGSRPPRTPTLDATTKVLARLLVYITIFVAMALVSGDPGLQSEEDQERQVGELQLTDENARAIAHPIARALTPTKLWARYGGAIIEHSDVLDALVNLYDYASALARYRRARVRRERGIAAAPSNGRVGVPMSGEHFVPVAASTAGEYIPPQTWGTQIGPSQEQLDEIRRRHEQAHREQQQ